jgi:hypothetical protein
VSEGVQTTVKQEVREAVAVVCQLNEEDGLNREAGATTKAIAEALKLDASAASRRLQAARKDGYVRNLESSRGRPARWVLGDRLPEDTEILPTPEALGACACVHGGSGGSNGAPAGGALPAVEAVRGNSGLPDYDELVERAERILAEYGEAA